MDRNIESVARIMQFTDVKIRQIIMISLQHH